MNSILIFLNIIIEEYKDIVNVWRKEGNVYMLKKEIHLMVIAASGLIIKDKKILLTKRTKYTNAFPEHWTCPGGRADEGETPEEAAIREVKEEVNLNFKPTRLFNKGKWKERDLYRFLGEWTGEIKIQEEEISEWKWFTYEEAIKLKLAFNYKEVLEKLREENII